VYQSWVGTRFETLGGLDRDWLQAFESFITDNEHMTEGVTLDKDWAQKQADRVLRDLGVTHMSLANIQKGVQFQDDHYKQFRLNRMGVNKDNAAGGYLLTYYRSEQGLQASFYYKTGGVVTPTFCPEQLTVFVTADGVQEFVWNNMAETVGIVAENTRLASFDAVIESFKDYLVLSAHPEAQHRYAIRSVELIAGNTPAYNAPAHAWQVPVWLIQYDYYGEIEPGVEIKTPGGACMFSAIDGAYMPFTLEE
jgi:hypothetical protein